MEAAERMRIEHASLIGASQKRQAALETANAELTASLTQKERDLSKVIDTARTGTSSRDQEIDQEIKIESLRKRFVAAEEELEGEQRRGKDLQKKYQQLETEYHSASVSFEEERVRTHADVAKKDRQIVSLQDQLGRTLGSAQQTIGGSKEDVQVQNLSKQLLKKQQLVLELQAERSALKSRNQDLQNKVSSLERQLVDAMTYDGTCRKTGFLLVRLNRSIFVSDEHLELPDTNNVPQNTFSQTMMMKLRLIWRMDWFTGMW